MKTLIIPKYQKILGVGVLSLAMMLGAPGLSRAQDATLPVISNIDESVITNNTATITWQTDKPTTSFVWYHETSGSHPYSSAVLNDSDRLNSSVSTKTHSVTLNSLMSDTHYQYFVGGVDENNKMITSNERTFVTKSVNNLTGYPVIVSFKATDSTTTKTTLEVVANENVTARVTYGLKGSSYVQMVQSSPAAKIHTIPLMGLSANTDYQAKVQVTDNDENVVTSDFIYFKTQNVVDDSTRPVMSGTSVNTITQSSAIVTWSSNEPTTSVVWYKMNQSNQDFAKFNRNTLASNSDNSYALSHSVAIQGLASGTKYIIRVGGYDQAGNLGQSDDITFVTLGNGPVTDSISPVTYNLSLTTSSGGRRATVSWLNDENTLGSVQYSTTSDFTAPITSTLSGTKYTKVHIFRMSGLQRNVYYYYRTISKDNSGNTTTSPVGIIKI